MALTVTITGPASLTHNDQGMFTATVIDTDTNAAPVGDLTYSWSADSGSFVGATDQASVTYHADQADNADASVSITCEVTLAANDSPTVSAPTLTAMTELGITGQLVNMLIPSLNTGSPTYPHSSDTLYHSDDDTLASGSDAVLAANLTISQIRWTTAHRLLVNRSGGGAFSDFWDAAQQGALSAYLIVNSGTVVELPGTWIGTGVGNGFVQWSVPDEATDVIAALDGIDTGDALLFGIADTDSIGLPAVTESGAATLSVTENEPPVVSVVAPARLNPGEEAQIDATITDPESAMVTVLWEATAGSFDDTAVEDPTFTAPDTPGSLTLTVTVTDAGGESGSRTSVIDVNAPPVVALTVPMELETSEEGELSAVVTDDHGTVTVAWTTTAGTIASPTALESTFTAPDTAQTVTVTCTATDSEGLTTVQTADITVNAAAQSQPPVVSVQALPAGVGWQKILESTETESSIVGLSQPFILRIEGTLGTETVKLQSRRRSGGETAPWITEKTGLSLTDTDPTVVFGGVPDTEYRVTVSSAGVEVFWNVAYPNAFGKLFRR